MSEYDSRGEVIAEVGIIYFRRKSVRSAMSE